MSNHEMTYGSTAPGPIAFLEGLYQRAAAIVREWLSEQHQVTRRVMVGALLTVALLAFELFNFDTTEYALEDLLGPVSFAGVRWATILAIAFCSIDFAGLARLITPDPTKNSATGGRFLKPTWLLLAAWLLGGGMNAIMTWWSVSLALMGHQLGNEVLTREQLLRIVPVFVAVLVWVTRILIISSFTITAEGAGLQVNQRPAPARAQGVRKPPARTRRPQPTPQPRPIPASPSAGPTNGKANPLFLGDEEAEPARTPPRPQMPRPPRGARPAAAPLGMRGRVDDGSRRLA
jgi:Zn-dependent protease with chaperone function